MRFIPIADVVSPHGIKGGLKIYLYNTDDPIIFKLNSVYLGTERDNRAFRILRVKSLGGRFCILNLDKVISRKEAEEYKGKKVYITPDMLPELPPNYVYLSLLIGYCVFDESGREIGVVEDFINNGYQDVMVVRHINGVEFMVPFVEEFIRKIDTERGQIFINMMEGLLE
ncbi:MAG: ribosome maturation factor RimM [Deltaproteobacteria bacterium]|nr:ribosome maturation factor RimM [Deltaproteobacteria bacterium]